jgi:hypothetical protein
MQVLNRAKTLSGDPKFNLHNRAAKGKLIWGTLRAPTQGIRKLHSGEHYTTAFEVGLI